MEGSLATLEVINRELSKGGVCEISVMCGNSVGEVPSTLDAGVVASVPITEEVSSSGETVLAIVGKYDDNVIVGEISSLNPSSV